MEKTSEFQKKVSFKEVVSNLKQFFKILVCKTYKISKEQLSFVAQIGWTDGENIDFDCLGSMISENFLLTAAHCLSFRGYENFQFKIWFKKLNFRIRPDLVRVNYLDFIPWKFYRYPQYRYHYHDIGLIQLYEPVTIVPICLATSSVVLELLNGVSFDGEILAVGLRVIDFEACKKSVRPSRRLRHGLNETQICAVPQKEDQDTCKGDSGSALIAEIDGTTRLIGITSMGSVCGDLDIPGLYTKVFPYLDWIEEIVWPNFL